jgi:hypothetical protein
MKLFTQNNATMETLNGTEGSEFALAAPFVVMLGFVSVCLMLTRAYHMGRRDDRRENTQNQQSRIEEADIILSSEKNDGHDHCRIGSCDGKKLGRISIAGREVGSRASSLGSSAGERAHLLENGHCIMYTQDLFSN